MINEREKRVMKEKERESDPIPYKLEPLLASATRCLEWFIIGPFHLGQSCQIFRDGWVNSDQRVKVFFGRAHLKSDPEALAHFPR